MVKKAVPVLIVGTVWGIFEATVGFLLHLLPIRIGFLVWYPVAVFFLASAYAITGRKAAILATAGLAAAIKLLNLLLPGRVDRVINPAVSILLEGFAVFAAAWACERVSKTKHGAGLPLVSLAMNTLWRVLYLAYLALLVPDWIREASVLGGGGLFRFLVVENLCGSAVVFVGMLFAKWLGKRATGLHSLKRGLSRMPSVLLSAALLALNVTLQMVL